MENKLRHIAVLKRGYVNLCRFVLAAVFIFSGFVKANDPWGFEYKLADYAAAFNLSSWLPSMALLPLGVAVSAMEFTLGIYLLFGINRRLTSWLVLLMMAVMTPLTLYLALANPVSDCGCFGDAVVLTNWQTFAKNVVLLVMAISVLVWRGSMFRVITHRTEWLVSFYALVYILAFSYYCLMHLPVFDFRPYRVGADIPAAMTIPEGEEPPVFETLFLMEKEGERREFTVEEYPDSTWTLVDRRTVLKSEGYEPPIHDFDIIRQEDGEDITDLVLSDEGYTLLMVAPRLEVADDGYIDLINELYDYSLMHGYAFYCLTASSDEQIERWQDWTGAEYPFCLTDETTLKTIVRANPGVVLLRGGVVLHKWSSRDLPDEYMLTHALEELPLGTLHIQGRLQKVAYAVLWFVCPLALVLLIDTFYRKREKRRLKLRLSGREENE